VSYSELAEHARYLGDEVKLAAYERALRGVLGDRSGRVVLDLGAGTGILGLLAARAGATLVHAVDSGSIIGPASEVARRSPHAASITHHPVTSTKLELRDQVDVVVCDQIGGFVHEPNILQYYADVRRRLLAPDGVMVPASFRLFLAPARSDPIRAQLDLWASHPAGFDFSTFHTLAVNTEHRVADDEVNALAEGVEVAEIAADHVDRVTGRGSIEIEVEDRCDGLVGWFVADLGGGATLTNRPGDPGRMRRWCTFYPLEVPRTLSPGDRVELDVDLRPLSHAVTWRTSIRAGGAAPVTERHSTLLGAFLSSADLPAGDAAPRRVSEVGAALREALTSAERSRSIDEILAEVGERWRGTPVEGYRINRLRHLLRTLTEPA